MKNKVETIQFRELFFSRTNAFLESYLSRQVMKSPSTVKAYRKNLGSFYDYITLTRELDPVKFRFIDCNYRLLLDYVQYMQETRKLAASSVNQNIASIKSYFKYSASIDPAVLQAYLAISDLPSLTVIKKIRPTITEDGLTAFFNAPANTKLGNRDRTILVLMYDMAARVGEMVRIKYGDLFNIESERITVLLHGKGRKEREIVLSTEASKHLSTYLKEFHAEDVDPETPLFYTIIKDELHPMSVRNMEHIVAKYGDSAKKTVSDMPKIHPHMLRRTRATDLYRDNVPLELISTILGHEQMETTRQYYAKPSPEQLSQSTEKAYEGIKDEVPLWKNNIKEIKKQFGLK